MFTNSIATELWHVVPLPHLLVLTLMYLISRLMYLRQDDSRDRREHERIMAAIKKTPPQLVPDVVRAFAATSPRRPSRRRFLRRGKPRLDRDPSA